MRILSINTVGVGTQLSISQDGGRTCISAGFSKHSESLFPLIEELMHKTDMEPSEITAVGVVTGPGSFTGIRIGLSVAKVMAYANSIPVIAMNALEVLGYNVVLDASMVRGTICATINAGGNKLYYQVFDVDYGVLTPKTQPGIMKVEHLKGYIDKYYPTARILYNASNEKPIQIPFEVQQAEFEAESLAMCSENNYKYGNTVGHNDVTPIYIRDSQAELVIIRDINDIVYADKTMADATEIVRLENQGNSEYMPWSEQSIQEMLVNKDMGMLVASYKGKMIGYIIYREILNEWEIERVMVDRGAMGQGVARALMTQLLTKAKQENKNKILLEVNEKNYPAYRLYSVMGFRQDGIRKNYYGEGRDAVLMSKNI